MRQTLKCAPTSEEGNQDNAVIVRALMVYRHDSVDTKLEAGPE